jgi:predicted amidohydrolase
MSSPLLHVALAQFKPRKGNYAANLERLREILATVNGLEPRPRGLVLPETALTGYFVEGGVRDLAVDAGRLARDIARVHREAVGRATGNGGPVPPLDVAIGFYERWQDTLYNSALYVSLGVPDPERDTDHTIRHVHRKNFLPTYGLFDEEQRGGRRGATREDLRHGW